jgi:hypothetical protein
MFIGLLMAMMDDIEVYSQNVDVFYGKGVLGSSICQCRILNDGYSGSMRDEDFSKVIRIDMFLNNI